MADSGLYAACVGALLACVAGADTGAADSSAPNAAATTADTQAHAFDFLMGTWNVQNTLLTKRMQQSHEWLKFTAICTEQPLRTGTGNLEYYLTDHWPDFVGMALRLYDPQSHKWTLFWSDNRFSRGALQPPLTGTFHGSVGVFEGADHLGTQPITVRFRWRILDHDHARWSQAFSRDNGRTWETNWIMKFTRTSENANASMPPSAQHSPHR